MEVLNAGLPEKPSFRKETVITKNLVTVPDNPYYLWQALVQMYTQGPKNAAWLFYCPKGSPSRILQGMIDELVDYEIHWWPDWNRRGYNPAAKPQLVGKYLEKTKYSGPYLIMDPDCIKTGQPLPECKENTILGTDTDSYTGPRYLKKKDAWSLLCSYFKIDSDDVFWYQGIGAQYITDLPYDFWNDVGTESIKVYHLLKDLPSPDGVPVQAWCAEMYTTQMVAIREGVVPEISPQMRMVWADDSVDRWKTDGFFHNAGVPDPKRGSFCKIQHQSWPKNIPWVDETKAASTYVKLIEQTKKTWPKLVSLFD